MPQVQINGNNYDVYADVAFADEYLAGDMVRDATWSALDAGVKPKALVSATRLLLRLDWRAGQPPAYDDVPLEVQQATAMLAADIALKPTLGDNAASGSNIKAVGAGSARVEFFAPVTGAVLPSAAFALLRGLLGTAPSDLDGVGLDNVAYGSSNCQRSRFDSSDYGRYGDSYGVVDPDERRLY